MTTKTATTQHGDAATGAGRRHILVTGGAGYIGSHTVVELLGAGYAVTVVDNLDNSSYKCLERVRQICGAHVEDAVEALPLTFHLVDLCNRAALDLVFAKSERFHAVIHFAGLKAVGESVQQPLRYYQNNLQGTLNLLELMEAHSCTNMIFSSSATVYGDPEVIPLPETAAIRSTNPYGRTKLFAEEILRDVAQGQSGDRWRIVLLRYFNPVGSHISGLIGEDPQGPPNNLMPYVAQVAVGRRECLSVFGNDYDTVDGTGVRDYIHVVDLAQGHVAALEQAIDGEMETNCEVFNLGTGNGYSVLQMVEAMKKASGKDIPYKFVERRAGDIATCYADTSKAEKRLKWKAKYGVDRMCEDQWRWQSQNPNGFQ